MRPDRAMSASALGLEISSVMDWAMRFARSGSVAASVPALTDVGERVVSPVLGGNGPGDAFRALRIGGCQA